MMVTKVTKDHPLTRFISGIVVALGLGPLQEGSCQGGDLLKPSKPGIYQEVVRGGISNGVGNQITAW